MVGERKGGREGGGGRLTSAVLACLSLLAVALVSFIVADRPGAVHGDAPVACPRVRGSVAVAPGLRDRSVQRKFKNLLGTTWDCDVLTPPDQAAEVNRKIREREF